MPLYPMAYHLRVRCFVWHGRVDQFARAKLDVVDSDPAIRAIPPELLRDSELKWGYSVARLRDVYADFAKYSRLYVPLEEGASQLFGQILTRLFGAHFVGARSLSYDEVLREMVTDTSAGYPHSRKYPDKAAFLAALGSVENQVRYFENFEKGFLEGKSSLLWTVSPKAEQRKAAKLWNPEGYDPAIRTFLFPPIEFIAVESRYFYDLHQRFYSAHMLTPSCVGWNLFSGGWHAFVSQHDGWVGWSLDARFYDSSQMAVLERLYRWYEQFVPPGVCRRLFEEAANARCVMPDGLVLQKWGGNNSGKLGTIVDNTLDMIGGVYTVLMLILRGPVPEDIRVWVYGDDVLLVCKSSSTLSVNWHGFVGKFRQMCRELFGFLLDIDGPPRRFTDLGFLSRKTVVMEYGGELRYAATRDASKVLWSLAHRSRDVDNWEEYEMGRMDGILQTCWPDPALRAVIRQAQRFLIEMTPPERKQAVWSRYHDDEWMSRLTHGPGGLKYEPGKEHGSR